MQSPDGLPALDVFLQFLYEGLEGYVYLAASDRKKENDWMQEFFSYPADLNKLKNTIRKASKTHEVYIAPAVFNRRSSLREDFKASNVVWTEFDGNAPDWNEVNVPSLILQSSTEAHQHVYWRLNEPVTDLSYLEDINRRITYNLGADSSAWDANQVLRPPETWNHKRDLPVGIPVYSEHVYETQVFIDSYAEPPAQLEDDWSVVEIPDVDKIILKYAFTPDMVKLLMATTEEVKDRSASLMNMAYAAAQINMANNEIMAVLLLLDNKWGKFKGRKDQVKRLSHIVTLAKHKHPGTEEYNGEEQFAVSFGWETLLDTDFELEWVIEPMLMDQGNMLFVGPSGVGKTQFMMQALIHLALGKDFLHYKIKEPKKVLWLSLEMGLGEVKHFAKAMRGALTDAESALLEENFIIIPHGEPWALNTPEGQKQFIEFIEFYEPNGIAIDSIGSAIQGNISSDEVVQPFTKYVDQMRNKYNLFWWNIHHMRKGRDGPPNQDDVYGNQYLLNRSTSTYALLRGKNKTMRLRNFKSRLAPLEDDHFLERTENLTFESITGGIDNTIEQNIKNMANGDDTDDTAGGFGL